MAEREALEREIEMLQNLIKDHKRAHGDAPSSSSRWFSTKRGLGRARGNPYYLPSYSHQPQPYAPDSSSQWKKQYSLNNKTTRAPGGNLPPVSETNLNKTRQVKGVATDTLSVSGVCEVLREGTSKASTVPSCSTTEKKTKLAVSDPGGGRFVLKHTRTNTESMELAESALLKSGQQSGLDGKMRQNASSYTRCSATSFVRSSEASSAFNKKQSQVKSYLTSTVCGNRTVIAPTMNPPAQASSMPAAKVRLKSSSTPKVQTAVSPHEKSRFTWVKSKGTEASQAKSQILHFSPSPIFSPPPSSLVVKQTHTPSKKLQRKLNFSSSHTKTSKYSWVSSSSSPTAPKSALAKPQNKVFSPRTLKMPGRAAKEGLEGKKCTTTSMISKRAKTSGGASPSHTSHASRYRWKAVAATSSVTVRGSTAKSSRKSSVYRWTAQKDEKDSASPASRVQPSSLISPLSSSGFKLRSRTKIIRRCSNSPTSGRRPSPGVVTVRSRYSLRRRTHVPVKTPSIVKRGHSRVLVSLGRHRLQRLSPSSSVTTAWNSRTGPLYPSVRNAASQRVIKTRYKIDTRRSHPQQHNSALSYRVKRVQSARYLLQSRLRSIPDRQWRGRGMRWIGGTLYIVSANKLSRTHTPCTPSIRSGKLFSPHDVSFGSSTYRTSNTQHVASRAVQKSLAIIRQARQKKQQAKNYCMYYNRFGKCNHGTTCPYIHDPDKVAVCTRFLRGTCKQTDGTCPFSHKVSKEKMPVCSYFLKGICNNSNCPYSHVYVSRKAAVCQDFIRGYCPQGEKCKKKHTLVCPDFSRTGVCPQGTKCKLQHRQRVKRAGSNLSSGSVKRVHESTTSPEAESTPEEGTPKSSPEKLPSFISLSSSPEAPEGSLSPLGPPGAGTEGTGKKLHIKPRFKSQNRS